MIVAFFVSLFALCRTATAKVFCRRLSRYISHVANCFRDVILGSESKEEFRPSSCPELTQTEQFSMILRRLDDFEEKVYGLQTKPVQMPSETEDSLNVVISRVDALEAELIDMKKAYISAMCFIDEQGLHEAQIKQEKLLAYIDTQKAAMSQYKKRKYCRSKKEKR